MKAQSKKKVSKQLSAKELKKVVGRRSVVADPFTTNMVDPFTTNMIDPFTTT